MSMWRLFCSLPFFARVKKNIHAKTPGRKGYLLCALASLRDILNCAVQTLFMFVSQIITVEYRMTRDTKIPTLTRSFKITRTNLYR